VPGRGGPPESSSNSRGSRVRTKIVALLVSLVALWAFAAYVTLQDGLNLLWVSTLDQRIGRPTDALITALQEERRLSLVYLGGGRDQGRGALMAAREQTNQAKAALDTARRAWRVQWAASPAAETRIADVLARVDGLGPTRSAVDSGTLGRVVIAHAYTGVIDSGFLVYDSLAQFSDEEIAAQGRTLVALTRSRDLLSQEDALLSGVLAEGRFAPGEPEEFIKTVGAQRAFYADDAARLPAEDRARYDALLAGATFSRLISLENLVVSEARANDRPAVDAVMWRETVDAALSDMRALELSLADATVARAQPAAVWTIVRLALAGGLGLIAVIASIVVSITTTRSLVRQLVRLRNAALELASYRLPRVVERLQQGERVDVAAEAPPLNFGNDEIGQVGQAFNTVQETAVRVAVEQAELRRSIRDVFLSLARRSQALLHRQLGLLDSMERRTTDTEELSELFRVDHLATRMRRNAENLIVLSGATAGRAWRKPVPMVDVLRGALAEVEDYTRVTVLPVGPATLVGRAVGDVIHLLAELIENAVSFSPPPTVVRVGGSVVGNGFAIEIEDRGLGMGEEERAVANEQLRHPPEFKLSSTARLGLYVVSKLAERHGIRIRLTESPYGGTTAIVLLPATLIADDLSDEGDDGGAGIKVSIPTQMAAIGAGTRPRPRHAADAPTREITAGPAAAVTRHRRRGSPPEVLQPEIGDELPWRTASPPAASPTGPISPAAPISPASPTGPISPAAPSSPPARSGPPTRGTEPIVYTPSGLPLRRRGPTPGTGPAESPESAPRRAGSARGNGSAVDDEPSGEVVARGEDVRSLMSSYRSGTLRGRDDASRLTENNNHPPELNIPKQDNGTDEGR
jgi:signal transduction histidine kinase